MMKWVALYEVPERRIARQTNPVAANDGERNSLTNVVFPLLDRERERQIAEMAAAMRRFLAIVRV
jgi:hypothetical protein